MNQIPDKTTTSPEDEAKRMQGEVGHAFSFVWPRKPLGPTAKPGAAIPAKSSPNKSRSGRQRGTAKGHGKRLKTPWYD